MTFIIFMLILGVLIIVHEFGHFIMAKKVGVKVEQFSFGFGPKLFARKKGDTEYSVSAIPLGGFVKLAGDNLEEYSGKPFEYYSKTPKQRAWIIFFGPLLNYFMGFLFFWLIFFVGYPTLTTKIGDVLEGFGAKEAGVQAGDKITEIDNKKVEFWEDMQKIIQTKKMSEVVKLGVLRNNKEITLNVLIKEKNVDDLLGQKHSVGLLGISPSEEIVKVRHGLFESFFLGLNKVWDLTILTYKALWRMITGQLSLKESVTGPLGVFFIASKAAELGIIPVLHLIAVLSVSLAIFNLLPLPVLDGGHIFLLGLEKIRGKGLGLKAEQVVTQTGLVLIITLAVFVTYNDIMRMFGEKISKFFGH